MNSSSPPPAPNPTQTAAAQTQSNRDTAITQYGLNATNQVTPYGNLSYSQSGTWDDGTPRFTATQTLSPEEQALYNQYTESQKKLGAIGGRQIDKVGTILDTPFKLDNEATESRLMELGRKRLDPVLTQRRDALETKLYNQGLQPGTEAWNRAITLNDQGQNDAYNQLLLTGRTQANQELLTERNQPLNEITALMSGSQVQQPNFVNTPNASVAPTDVAGITQQGYQNSLIPWQNEQQQQQAMLGGLFGLGGTALGGWARGRFARPPGFAEGGRPPVGQPAIVGEEGPELFVPDQPGTVVPNRDLTRSDMYSHIRRSPILSDAFLSKLPIDLNPQNKG